MKNIWNVKDQLGLKKQDHPIINLYCGVFSTGDFDALYDYDAGLLQVSFTVVKQSQGEKGFCPLIAISTIDDGVWQAFAPNCMGLDECNQLIEKIANAWPWKTKLPSEKEINDFIMHFGMWGKYTG